MSGSFRIRSMSGRELEAVQSAADSLVADKSSYIAVRDRAILAIIATMGLRVSEVARLNLDDYRNGKLLIAGHKKIQARRLPVPTGAQGKLDAYIRRVQANEAGPLFLSRTNKRLVPNQIVDALKKIEERARKNGMEDVHITGPRLRYTCISNMAKVDRHCAEVYAGSSLELRC